MSKIAIFFGSATGNTEDVAGKIADKLEAEVFNVADNPNDKLEEYDNLIFGTSTWGDGDLQDDWEDFISEVKSANLEGKVVAIFGCGDGNSNPDTFCDGMSHIYNVVKEKGCEVVGAVSTEGYEYDSSQSVIDGKFIGLAIDEMNQDEMTDERVEDWVEQIKGELK